ncbi:MAG: rod shape-determining protein RodA [Deltaproteobacteria bacterium]|nr:rod shape-determining protein RodA [Deltaproteobacteria bacterium]
MAIIKFNVKFDWKLLVLALIICAMSLIVLYSAGFDFEEKQSFSMTAQCLNIIVGLIAFFCCAILSPEFWRRWSYLIYGFGCVLLVLVFGIGVVGGGARRWLDFGFIQLQPSEIMKIGLILTMARFFSAENSPRDGYNLFTLLKPAMVIGIPAAMILVQPDLGTAGILCLVGGSMLLVAGVKLRTIITIVLLAGVLLIPAWGGLEEYQKNRVRNFLSPELDPMGTGYHAIQSKIAVGSGQLLGKGYLKGTQTQLRFLPEQTTDFIFSVLAEEWGFVGAAALIAMYVLLILRLCMLANRASDGYGMFICVGTACYVFWHAFINMGMVIGILPVVGITLPLVSYGGTSVVSILAVLGFAAGAGVRRGIFS